MWFFFLHSFGSAVEGGDFFSVGEDWLVCGGERVFVGLVWFVGWLLGCVARCCRNAVENVRYCVMWSMVLLVEGFLTVERRNNVFLK